MQRTILKSKIHNAVIMQTKLTYEGSITIDGYLMDKADIVENERVQVVNINNGARLETYVIRGKERSSYICLNGPAARLGVEGDRIHILTYVIVNDDELENVKPAVLILNEKNEIIEEK